MDINDIKNKIISAPDENALTELIAQNWAKAQHGLFSICDDDYRDVNVADYPLQTICLVINDQETFFDLTGGQCEILVEKLKSVFNPIDALLDVNTDLTLPSYIALKAIMPLEGEKPTFQLQLKEDFKRLDQEDSDALAMALYGTVYAYYHQFDSITDRSLKFFVEDPYEIGCFARMSEDEQNDMFDSAVQRVYSQPHTAAPTTYTATAAQPRPIRIPGKWRPLKAYLIITGLLVAIALGLFFYSLYSGIGVAYISVRDVTGQSVSVQPGMDPVELTLVGTLDYDGIINLLKTVFIGFIIYRLVLIFAVFKLNKRYRRKKAAQAGLNYIP